MNAKQGFLHSFLSFILILTVITLSACAGGVSYASDIPVTDLVSAADGVLNDSTGYASAPDTYIKGRMGIDTADFDGYSVKINVIDEYGIFKLPEGGDVDAAKNAVEAYLDKRVEEWMPEYMPEEFPKVENASVKVMGQYVVYCILGDDAKADVFSAIEDKLTAK